MQEMLVWWTGHTSDSYRASFLCSKLCRTTRLHVCTCRLLTACFDTSHANTWEGLLYQVLSGFVSAASNTSVATSTFSKILASLLLTWQGKTCINASTGLFTVYTYYHALYIASYRVMHHLAGIQHKDLDWDNHILQWLWELTSTLMRSQRSMQYLYQRSQMGLVPAARAVRLQIYGRDTQLQTHVHIGVYTLYRLLWPGRSYIPWTMWLCSKEHTIAKLFEELWVVV